MTNLPSRAGFGSSYINACQEIKKPTNNKKYFLFQQQYLKDNQRTSPSITPTIVSKFVIQINSTIYVPKLGTHPTEDANAESSAEIMDVESSKGIESPSSHDNSY